jgi:predicted aminopeptidase
VDVLKSFLPRLLLLTLTPLFLCSCQIGYYAHTGYNQMGLLWNRVPVEKALKDPRLSPEQKEKLKLAEAAREFAQKKLGLKSNGNYASFVWLDRDAVTYVVQVAQADALKAYRWKFPFIGKVPYKGFFKKSLAEKEAASFPPEKYDTWIRGVKAYSTLGWFRDPITSPMLTYSDRDLVETIIHELTHTTLYIKSNADFNERLATFVGVEGSKKFYREKEGENSPTVLLIEKEQKDLQAFSEFISAELKDLRAWYQQEDKKEIPLHKKERIQKIQTDFEKRLQPKLSTDLFSDFPKRKLNNAVLLSYETYVSNLSPFQDLYEKLGRDLTRFMREVSKLKDSKTPDADLTSLLVGESP